MRIAGRDRASFLHNMCTNDIKSLQIGQQCEAFLTDVRGKIVGHVIVFADAEQLLLLTVPHQAERIISSLDRYLIREDVALADETRESRWILNVGPSSGRALAPGEVEPMRSADAAFAPCTQIWPHGAWHRFRPEFPDAPNPTPDDERLWHALRVESGWPLYGVDFDGSNLPQEVNRDAQAISFRKGCYLGQETIARIDALGHVNKRLATVQLGAEAAAGDELFSASGESVGRITSASYSPHVNGWLALAMIRRGHHEPGAQLVCVNQSAVVVPTPAASRD